MNRLIDKQIQYVEFLSPNLVGIKKFYTDAFGWQFTDYGSDYTAFGGEYVDGGFARGEVVKGSVLVILYSDDLEEIISRIEPAGGKIEKDIFEFPGGRRFEFVDPDGNQLAVWSDK